MPPMATFCILGTVLGSLHTLLHLLSATSLGGKTITLILQLQEPRLRETVFPGLRVKGGRTGVHYPPDSAHTALPHPLTEPQQCSPLASGVPGFGLLLKEVSGKTPPPMGLSLSI